MARNLLVPPFERTQVAVLKNRLSEPRRFMQVVAGPRQVGKTTLVTQALAQLGVPHVFISADEPTLRDAAWLAAQWERARAEASAYPEGAVLAIDEVQKAPHWPETVKRLWDEDTRSGLSLHVVLLGSSPLLVQQGLTESLAGRFEVLRAPHWSLAEMREAFGFDLEAYLAFGGYPGAAPLVGDPERWRRYLLDALIETTIARDVLLMTRVDKPALLRRTFELGCRYSGQILSYTKMLGQLQEAGNTTTLAHYLELLAGAGMLTGLSKYAGEVVRQRGSSPKLQVFNTALMTAIAGRSADASWDAAFRGRLAESAVGAHLVNAAFGHDLEVFYWRERDREVDFVVKSGPDLLAIEVKSGAAQTHQPGLDAFTRAFPRAHPLIVGGDGVPLEAFLERPVRSWLGA